MSWKITTASPNHVQTRFLPKKKLIEFIYSYCITRRACRWGGATTEEKLNLFAQQENRIHSRVCSRIDIVMVGGRRRRGCREKIKGPIDRKRVKMSVASLKDSGTAAAWSVQHQVNTSGVFFLRLFCDSVATLSLLWVGVIKCGSVISHLQSEKTKQKSIQGTQSNCLSTFFFSFSKD